MPSAGCSGGCRRPPAVRTWSCPCSCCSSGVRAEGGSSDSASSSRCAAASRVPSAAAAEGTMRRPPPKSAPAGGCPHVTSYSLRQGRGGRGGGGRRAASCAVPAMHSGRQAVRTRSTHASKRMPPGKPAWLPAAPAQQAAHQRAAPRPHAPLQAAPQRRKLAQEVEGPGGAGLEGGVAGRHPGVGCQETIKAGGPLALRVGRVGRRLLRRWRRRRHHVGKVLRLVPAGGNRMAQLACSCRVAGGRDV